MYIQQWIVNNLSQVSFTGLFIIFAGAFILSFGSCTIIRIPIVLGYVTGVSLSRRDSFLIVSGFSLGLIFAYMCLGMLFGIGGRFIYFTLDLSTYLYLISGFFVLFLGVYLLGFLPKFKPSDLKCKINNKIKNKIRYNKINFLSAFLFGTSFAFFEAPLCPCCGPLLLLISSYVLVKTNFIYSLLAFFFYGLGQSLPIFLIATSAHGLKYRISQKIHILEVYIQTIAGVILFCMGLYLIWLA